MPTPHSALPENFARFSVSAVISYLARGDVSEAHGKFAMTELLEENLALANEVLCHLYEIACYHVGSSYAASQAPAEDQDKWFVTHLAGLFLDVEIVPLADSEAHAQSLAVSHLKLKDLFFAAPTFSESVSTCAVEFDAT
jgi:hypothetical protein